MGRVSDRLQSVCVFCGSADAADPAYLAAANALGRDLAAGDLKLVYGGGGVGLMGAVARGAHEAGGAVLGIIPDFLVGRERAFDSVETIVVTSMHQRKQMMFEQSDGFVILPGGVGTLEEVVELLSWRRLDLHAKPVVFYNPDGFWNTLFAAFQTGVDARLTPPEFMHTWVTVERVEDIIPGLERQGAPQEIDTRKVTKVT